MPPERMIVWLLVYVAVAAVVIWFMSKVKIPEPFTWVAYLFVALIAIWMILQLPWILGPIYLPTR